MKRIIYTFCVLFQLSFFVQAQTSCPVSCNNSIQVSLDQNCEAIINADLVLEGDPSCYTYADYTVMILEYPDANAPVIVGSPLVTGAYVGTTLGAKIIAPDGNSCWGALTIEDKLAPSIECSDISILCTDAIPEVQPIASDACDSDLEYTYTDNLITDGADCDDTVIERTWTATDDSGNASSCVQVITIEPVDAVTVVFPENLDGIENPYLNCANADTTAANTGTPTINGLDLYNNSICNLIATLENEEIIAICEGTYKIVRTWNVTDWCSGQMYSDVQIIKVVDEEGPAISCPTDIQVSVGANSCEATVLLPTPSATDLCSTTITYDIATTSGVHIGNTLYGLGLGSHTITYTATDDCDNSNDCSFHINVVDEELPIAVCDEHTIIGLYESFTEVNASVFDDGSYDHCGDISLSVRRMESAHCPGPDATNYLDVVPFYCCDVGNVVMVELRVEDEAGNVNYCMVEAEVQDKLAPAITCPENITIDCDQDYTDLNLTGDASSTDNCPGGGISSFDIVNIDNCGEGTIVRTWTAEDAVGNTSTCSQVITLLNMGAFNESDIDWPFDYTTNGCMANLDVDNLSAPYDEPVIDEDACDLVAFTHEDLFLPIAGNGCGKVLRTWTVIDWCQFDPNDPDLLPGYQIGGDGLIPGYWTYVQELIVMNNNDPEITEGLENLEYCNTEEDECELFYTGPLTIVAIDDCTPDAELNISYEVDLTNDGGVDYTGIGTDASGDFPIGEHRIVWTVEDGCGNSVTGTKVIWVKDCVKPIPYAINGLAIEMPASGSVTVQSTQIDAGSYDNCGIDWFRIVAPSQGPGQTQQPTYAQTGNNHVTFTCDDIAEDNTILIDFWVKDIHGNWNYVITYIIVEDNMGVCGDPSASATIAGTIQTEEGQEVENVSVNLGGSGIPSFMTNTTGSYAFPSMPTGGNYTVDPDKNINPLNGVSTFDLVLMGQHILGNSTLDSPYKMIAADINKSGTITTFDMVELRKLILYIDTDFQTNTSWRFVDQNYIFPNPTNPFGTNFPEVVDISTLSANEQADFIAIKVGDLNSTAVPNSLVGASNRNIDGTLAFEIDEASILAGETITVDFKAKDFKDLLGYQFTLKVADALDFVEVNSDHLSTDNFGFALLDKGVITASWANHTKLNLEDDEVVFSLTFKSNRTTQLSNALSINSEYTNAEAYTKDGQFMDVTINFNTENGLVDSRRPFELYQNQPNPFNDQTVIGFVIPEADQVSLQINDLSGKLVKVVEGNFSKGYNEITLERSDFESDGIYYFHLRTSNRSATKKLVILK